MAELRLEKLSRRFKGGIEALSGVSFEVADREAVFLLGPSGAGKTTTLRLVAGLEVPTEGSIRIGGRDVTHWQPRQRNLAMVYDKHSLFPHLTVFDNLAYPLRNRKLPNAEIRSRVDTVAEMLQVGELLGRYPSQLSGGQMQRVAIGRALVRDADVYLFDEPISHLDAKLRARMRVEFKRLQRDFQATMLYVSHDQLEAMTMADRIVLINRGRIEQIAAPQQLFDCPETLFAATFVGEPAMNTFAAVLTEENGGFGLRVGSSRIELDHDWLTSGTAISPEADYVAGIRPQHITLAGADEAGENLVRGRVFAVETLGSRIVFDIEAEGTVVRILTTVDIGRRFPRQSGKPIAFRIAPEFLYLFDARTGHTVRHAQFAGREAKPTNSAAPGARRQ
ncbi:ABC transporter ATP-binding protein [Chelativorans sp. AA-79]|uniref:ABC transporter ATP-binding protein n=1 Tax=Chelativorans sp. AA-79 TaxID=3028735 RepID=UPI0023F8BD94|nr:ABC transporter ATP-binding protein [Chelativorans sp. AA-79]WEX08981.1 ABC transporter ATP-binding protein [Chelativorans sp. AA-79]